MTRRRQSQRDRERRRELNQIWAAQRSIEAGDLDHMFADAETKAAMLADIRAMGVALIKEEFEAHPELYEGFSDGTWQLRASARWLLRTGVSP